MTETSDEKQRQREDEAPPFWEWVVAGIGTLLLLSALAFFAYEALQQDEGPPQPVVRVTSIDRQGSGYTVRLQVHNAGRSTAANLRVAGVLVQDGKELERSDTEFQYLPGRSSREAGLFFTRDPRQHALQVRAESYQEP
jgi:uncharacterized protein (TIGR02588 family)